MINDIFIRNAYGIFQIDALSDVFCSKSEYLEKKLIIDCGANIGISSLFFARYISDSTILAVEPDIENFRLLQKNTKNYKNIIPILGAVGNGDYSRAKISNGDAASDSFQVEWVDESDCHEPSVPVYSIDDLCTMVHDARSYIIKIDIEGAERDLFQSNLSWVDNFPYVIVEPHDWLFPNTGCFAKVSMEMALRNYNFFILGQNIVFSAPRNVK